MAKIKAVLWDLDSTLIDYHIPERNAIIKCFDEFGLGQCPEEFLNTYHDVNVKWWDKLEKGLMTKERITVGRFEEMLSAFGYDSSIASEFNRSYMEHLSDTVCPIDGAKETLTALHGKVFQAIATNGVERTQRRKIINGGFDNLVDRIYISDVLGADKPALEFYNKILEDLSGFEKDEIMMVGDSLTSDMTGGNNAGLVCCWFNPEHKVCNLPLKIDYEISSLKDVLEVIDELA